MKTAFISLIILLFFNHAIDNKSTFSPAGDCEEFLHAYDDATENFNTHLGKEHVETGLFGESKYWEYELTPWNAVKSVVYPDLFSTARMLELTYCTGSTRQEANSCHADLQRMVEKCIPVEYYLYYGEPDDDGNNFVEFIDKRDGNPEEDLIFTYKYPQLKILVTKNGAYYEVSMEIRTGDE